MNKKKAHTSKIGLSGEKSTLSATNTAAGSTVGTDGMYVQVRSLNDINPSYNNVERLFHEACTKVKEGFVHKKFPFSLPDHLSDSSLPVEALGFDRQILILIADKMGVKMTNRLAIEAILVAEKLLPGEKEAREKHHKMLENTLGS